MCLGLKRSRAKLVRMTCKFSPILLAPTRCICHFAFDPRLVSLVTLAVPTVGAAFCMPATLLYLLFFSFSSFGFQLLPLSLSGDSCLSFTQNSCKNSVLLNILLSCPTGSKNPSDSHGTLSVSPSHIFACCKGVMDLPIYAPFCFVKSERTEI